MSFCTSCGKEIGQNKNFCEYCGTQVRQPKTHPASSPTVSPLPPSAFEQIPLPAVPQSSLGSYSPTSHSSPDVPPVSLPKVPPPSKIPKAIIAAVVIIIIVFASGYFIIFPRLSGNSGLLSGIPGSQTPEPTMEVTISPTMVIPTSTTIPTPMPEPYPNALPLKKWFPFSGGKTASEGTVYRYWINDTYTWHNDADNKWYTQSPKSGNKYLLVFANVVNRGDTAFPYPKSNSIYVHYDGNVYPVDLSHYVPDKAGNRDATPTEIGEIQYQSDLFNMEYVEDYGYAHGTTANFVYPGTSNAIDGYLIYEVPVSLTPDQTFVEIVFTDKERAVWKLA